MRRQERSDVGQPKEILIMYGAYSDGLGDHTVPYHLIKRLIEKEYRVRVAFSISAPNEGEEYNRRNIADDAKLVKQLLKDARVKEEDILAATPCANQGELLQRREDCESFFKGIECGVALGAMFSPIPCGGGDLREKLVFNEEGNIVHFSEILEKCPPIPVSDLKETGEIQKWRELSSIESGRNLLPPEMKACSIGGECGMGEGVVSGYFREIPSGPLFAGLTAEDLLSGDVRGVNEGLMGVGFGGMGYPFPTKEDVQRSVPENVEDCYHLIYCRDGNRNRAMNDILPRIEARDEKKHVIRTNSLESNPLNDMLIENGYSEEEEDVYKKGDKIVTISKYENLDKKAFQREITQSLFSGGMVCCDGSLTACQAIATASHIESKCSGALKIYSIRENLNTSQFISGLRGVFDRIRIRYKVNSLFTTQDGKFLQLDFDKIDEPLLKKFVEKFDVYPKLVQIVERGYGALTSSFEEVHSKFVERFDGNLSGIQTVKKEMDKNLDRKIKEDFPYPSVFQAIADAVTCRRRDSKST